MLYDLADKDHKEIAEILEPAGAEVGFSEFDAPESLVVYVRENYKYFFAMRATSLILAVNIRLRQAKNGIPIGRSAV